MWPSWEERTVQFGKATQLAGTMCCRLYQTGGGRGGEQEKQLFYYRNNLINWLVKTTHFSAFPSFSGNKPNFTSSPSKMNLPCLDIFQNFFLFKPLLLRMHWETLFRNDILHCKKKKHFFEYFKCHLGLIQGIQVISLYKGSQESYTDLGHQSRKGFWESNQ